MKIIFSKLIAIPKSFLICWKLFGIKKAFQLPRPMIGSGDFDFSFSGLKTAVLNLSKKEHWDFTDESYASENTQLLSDICASVEDAIVDVLTKKTIAAAFL